MKGSNTELFCILSIIVAYVGFASVIAVQSIDYQPQRLQVKKFELPADTRKQTDPVVHYHYDKGRAP